MLALCWLCSKHSPVLPRRSQTYIKNEFQYFYVFITLKKLFINNEFVDAKSGKTFETINPANGKTIARVAEADKVDVDRAVQAAKDAFKLGSPWRRSDASHRGVLLHKLADLMQRDAAHLAALESLDNGKPYQIALNVDVPASIDTLRFQFLFQKNLKKLVTFYGKDIMLVGQTKSMVK